MTFDDLCPQALQNSSFTVRVAISDICLAEEDIRITQLTPLYRKYWHETSQGKIIGKLNQNLRLAFDKPSKTLRRAEGNGGVYHPTECRSLSSKELARLQSFPDKFLFANGRKNAKDVIGNSVPPGLMRALVINIENKLFARHIQASFPKSMSYLEILEATWQEHLTPKDKNAPTVISTFAGCGGSSLGYSMAGFKELLVVEWNDNAVETFKLNFPDISIYHGDIIKLPIKECMNLAELTKPGELDVLDGSPPCQGFSLAGKRQMKDTRNQLFHEFARLLRGLQPKAFIIENVSGMVKGKMKLIFADILRELKASGYEVKCWLLNVKYFYVPQNRERLFFIGVRQDYWQECLEKDSLTSL